MVFSDLFFIFVFLPAFMLLYLLGAWVDRRLLGGRFTVRNAVLVVFSLLFYAWGEPVYVALMLVCVLFNYLCGLGLGERRDGDGKQPARRKAWLVAGLALNLGVLATFKYLGFFAGALRELGVPLTGAQPDLPLPIGISFYTFQSVSYLVDVYRGTSPVQRRFGSLLLYIAMFPQLIAGPIVRYGTVAMELHDRHVTARDFAEGAFRFLVGLAKKVVIANMLYEVVRHFLDGDLSALSTAGAWVGIVAFTLQIYFDFSGYSDMAIGMGRCLGFHFNENFRHPYVSRSITDFWRRWHISLGSFFRDYVYIPMGGNRRNQVANIMTVWFLTGLWHGASLNFVIWGLYFGLILMVEKYALLRVPLPGVVRHLYTSVLIVLGWGIFYFTDFGRMELFFRALFGRGAPGDGVAVRSALMDNFFLWILALMLCLPLHDWLKRLMDTRVARVAGLGDSPGFWVAVSVGKAIFTVAMLAASVALLVGATNNAFIYTRF